MDDLWAFLGGTEGSTAFFSPLQSEAKDLSLFRRNHRQRARRRRGSRTSVLETVLRNLEGAAPVTPRPSEPVTIGGWPFT